MRVSQSEEIKITIGVNIANYRKAIGLSRTALAEKVGLTVMAIGQYERGERAPSIENLCKIADTLNATVNDLVGTPIDVEVRISDVETRIVEKVFQKVWQRLVEAINNENHATKLDELQGLARR